ncbi:hypothetical protein Shell_0589 [Staphylothermus hellenicus DSM 12710]|uniref:Uncharacterized protein n=1 Tax=Staphylothermus hellenicus (strain DSM 12710 / JCM 10830 / BK20S6-10-b1 / P8) TaxID=591019 RepID=D7DC17_STAHD|nr:hypothetical protein Shell_0589 [Staphylothermus hellenicus DSM 12710]
MLEREKGERDWSSIREAFEELRRILDDRDYEEIIRSSKSFRDGFRLR